MMVGTIILNYYINIQILPVSPRFRNTWNVESGGDMYMNIFLSRMDF